jgi:hypothetical protein
VGKARCLIGTFPFSVEGRRLRIFIGLLRRGKLL